MIEKARNNGKWPTYRYLSLLLSLFVLVWCVFNIYFILTFIFLFDWSFNKIVFCAHIYVYYSFAIVRSSMCTIFRNKIWIHNNKFTFETVVMVVMSCIHWPPKFNYRFNALHIKTVAQLIFYANAGANKLLYSEQFLNVIEPCAPVLMCATCFVFVSIPNKCPLKERNQFTLVVFSGDGFWVFSSMWYM